MTLYYNNNNVVIIVSNSPLNQININLSNQDWLKTERVLGSFHSRLPLYENVLEIIGNLW